jgi:hypothetical protein
VDGLEGVPFPLEQVWSLPMISLSGSVVQEKPEHALLLASFPASQFQARIALSSVSEQPSGGGEDLACSPRIS